MKKNLLMLMLVSSVVWGVFGCSSSLVTGVPQNSVLVGVYDGTFKGAFNEGTVEVKIYRAPDGTQPCFGHFGEDGSYLNFRGEISAGELQGEILLPLEGTISGNLSADGNALSGTYKFTIAPFDHGTWQAQKQS